MGNCAELFQKRKQAPVHNCPVCHVLLPQSMTVQEHLIVCQRNRALVINNSNRNLPNQNMNVNNLASNQVQLEFQRPPPNLVAPQVNNQRQPPPLEQKKSKQYKSTFNQNQVWTKVFDDDDKTKYKWKQVEIEEIIEKDLIKKLSPLDIRNFSFEEKQIWFRYKLEKLRIPWTDGADWMEIHTDNVLLTSLNAIELVNMHKEVKISINGDKVQDAGGLLREWIHMITKEIFDINTGLFVLADSSETTYKINQEADSCDHIKNCFKLFGKIIGKAIFERVPFQGYIDKTIIRQLLGQPVTIDDIYSYDQQLYKSWQFLKANALKPDDFIGYMVSEKKTLKGKIEIALIERGEDIEICEENKLQYIDLSIQYMTCKSVKDFIESIKSGFYSVIPKHLIEIFDVNEIEMILNGLPFINIDDWEQNSIYKNGYAKNHKQIIDFWSILRSFSQEKLEKFLHFCTGSSRTSVEGFKKLESNRGNFAKFCIELVKYDDSNPYPKAHTCFNRLELPLYPSKEILEKYMQIIVNTDLDGIFGMEQGACPQLIEG